MANISVAQVFEDKQRSKDVLFEENVRFDCLMLEKHVFQGLKTCGFEKTSPIQYKAIPLGLCGFDLVVKSKSGTGKTLVFTIVALQTIDPTKSHTQVLILTPTREIATQTEDVLKNVGQHIACLKVESFIGGLSTKVDIEKCKSCHIAVGTPGRLKYLINHKHLQIDQVRLFILDEADKLMESSFQSDINEIYNTLPERKQMITTSATYANNLDIFLSQYMISPTHITSELETSLLLGLKQFATTFKPHANVVQQMRIKNEKLVEIFANISFVQCLVFSNYQTRAESISNILNQKGWQSVYISAAQTQPERLEAISNLKQFKCRILLSTDLTARGIDAANVDLVINYDVPNDAMTYLHRMGRAGRFGSSGACIDLAFEGTELLKLQQILGTIAGSNYTIPLLPALNKHIDLLNLDRTNLDCIKAVVPESKEHLPEFGKVLELKNSIAIDDAKIEEDFDTTDLLEQMCAGNFSLNADELIKKRKRPLSAQSNSESQVLHKNKALFSVTKLLSDSITTESDIKSIEKYLESFDDEVEDGNEDLNLKSSENLENIFRLSYDYAVKPNTKHWMDYVPDIEIKEFEELNISDKTNDYQIEEEDASKESDSDHTYDFMKWVPAEKEKEAKHNQIQATTYYLNNNLQAASSKSVDKFEEHYAECSNNLWQTGLSFESVEAFDDWFYYEWQAQVNAVRNFIQQNVYVEEMAKYQKSQK